MREGKGEGEDVQRRNGLVCLLIDITLIQLVTKRIFIDKVPYILGLP